MNLRLRKKLTSAWRELSRRQVDRLAGRAAGADRVRSLAERGQVAVVTSGMDCDGTTWCGEVYLVDAIPTNVERFLRSFYDGAEGPQSHQLMRPSEARGIRAAYRDLALEAFEEGRPHSISGASV